MERDYGCCLVRGRIHSFIFEAYMNDCRKSLLISLVSFINQHLSPSLATETASFLNLQITNACALPCTFSQIPRLPLPFFSSFFILKVLQLCRLLNTPKKIKQNLHCFCSQSSAGVLFMASPDIDSSAMSSHIETLTWSKAALAEEVNPVDTLPVPEAPTCSLVSNSCNIPKPPPLPSKISTRSKCLGRPLECRFVPKETTHTWDKLFKDGYGADVCIVTEDRSCVPAHSIVLRIASPVLGSIIEQSKVKHGIRYIKILGVPNDAVRVFLRFLYSSRYEEEELKKFALHLLVLSHAYSVPQLKRVCISLLEKGWLNRENVIDVLQLARNCDAPRLAFICIRMVVKDFKSVSSTEGWKVMKRANPALEQELVESVVEADSRKQERQRKTEEKKVYVQLYEAMEALLHICKDGCRTIGPRDKVLKGNQVTCNFPACKGLEALVRHFSGCKTRVPGGCSHCKRMWQLLELHSRMCNEPDSCKVPLCRHFKEKIQQQCKKDETKWKLLVSKVIAAKNAVGPLSSRSSGLL